MGYAGEDGTKTSRRNKKSRPRRAGISGTLYFEIEGDRASTVYDSLMMVVIIVSLVPLAFKETNLIFNMIDMITACAFILDYVLRLLTADMKLQRGVASFCVISVHANGSY